MSAERGRKPMLTEAAVRLIRRDYDAAITEGRRPPLAKYARRYGMCSSAIQQIGRRLTYRWVQP